MKALNYLFTFFFALSLCIGFTSCSDDDEQNVTETNYSDLLPGHWANTNVSGDITQTLSINYHGPGTIAFYDLVDNDWGIMAFGSYTLSGNTLVATYDDVDVTDSDYKPTTYHGFTNGKSKTIQYTIVSCDGKKFVFKDESGITMTYVKL